MIKRWNIINGLFLLCILILQIIPFSVPIYTLNSNSPPLYEAKLYSYFSLYTLIHYNITPMVSGIAVIAALSFSVISFLKNNEKAFMFKAELICVFIAMAAAISAFFLSKTFMTGFVGVLLIILFVLLIIQWFHTKTTK